MSLFFVLLVMRRHRTSISTRVHTAGASCATPLWNTSATASSHFYLRLASNSVVVHDSWSFLVKLAFLTWSGSSVLLLYTTKTLQFRFRFWNIVICSYFKPVVHILWQMFAWIECGWNKFRQLIPLLTNRDISLITRGRLYSSCVRSSMLHRSETWSVRKENEVALQRAEMRMVRWMCDVQVKDKVPSKEQNRLRWYGHVLQKEDTDWVNKCIEY